MSKQIGGRFRAIKDDTTNPTLFKVLHSQTFLQDETVLSHIDGFINNNSANSTQLLTPEAITANSNYSGINPTVLSQLNRLQRSLRGLPPLFEDEAVPSSGSVQADNKEEKVNTKIVFDD